MDGQRVLSQVQTIFGGRVKYLHLGCPDDFHPKSVGFKDRMNQVLTIIGHHNDVVVAPRVQFTNRIAIQQLGAFVYEEENGLWRTPDPTDGVIIQNTAPAAIFNADCHIGILYHEKTHRLALIHLGLKCFYREDGSSSIIDQAIFALSVPVHELLFWYGAGIGPCCNGYDHSSPQNAEFGNKLNQTFSHREETGLYSLPVVGYAGQYSRTPEGKVLYGPRFGQTSYSNADMLFSSAISHSGLGVMPSTLCTSCQGREQHPDLPQMWSNVRGHEQRNLFLCWLA